MRFPQDIRLAIPLLVVAAGDKSQDCDDIMRKVCQEPFEVEIKNFHALTNLCKQNEIEPPPSLMVHPILCKTVSQLIQLGNILNVDKVHFFLRCFSTLVFIDNSLNNDFKNIQAQFLQFPGVYQDTCSFLILKASECLIEYHSDSTYLCFESYSDNVISSSIREFLGRTAATSATRLLEMGLESARESPHVMRKLKCDFAAISGDLETSIKILKKSFKDLETKDHEWVASAFETLGMIEEREEGIAKKNKLLPGGSPPPSFTSLPSIREDTSQAVQCYCYAAGYYQKAGYLDKVVDCGIRMILSGCTDMIHSVSFYIRTNYFKYGHMQQKAWDLLALLKKKDMKRQAALAANQFAEMCGDVELESSLRIFALNLLLKHADMSGLLQLRNLCMPMFARILANPTNVPSEIMSKFTCKLLSAIGPKLTKEEQRNLFSELENVNPLEIDLPIEITNIEVKKLPYDIIRAKKESSTGKRDVFIYSYLSAKKNNSSEPMSVPFGQIVTVDIDIFNPFAMTLTGENIKLITNNENIVCKRTVEHLKPLSTTRVHMHIVPMQITQFTIRGLKLHFCGAKQSVAFAKEIPLMVVDNVPRYHLRTDLPLSSTLSLYDGEIHEFHLWITNSGESPITDLKINFEQPELVRIVGDLQLPIMPSSQIDIKCSVTADKNEDRIDFTLITSCEGSDYSCSHFIRQRMTIEDSLSVRRIFMLKSVPPSYSEKEDQICVGYEVENLSNCTFKYDAIVSETKMTGLVGSRERFLMVANYATSELRSDGSDAQKSRIIALTKFMEEKQGSRLRPEQRIKIAKCVSIMQRLEAKWKFDWSVSSTRHGKLVSRAAVIDEDLYQGIESRKIVANIAWYHEQNREEAKCIKVDEVYELVADYGNERISECELVFTDDAEATKAILWQGELRQKSDSTKYCFVLCFGTPSVFRMKIIHTSVDGISGSTTVIVRVS